MSSDEADGDEPLVDAVDCIVTFENINVETLADDIGISPAEVVVSRVV
jgi:hypothetical protein